MFWGNGLLDGLVTRHFRAGCIADSPVRESFANLKMKQTRQPALHLSLKHSGPPAFTHSCAQSECLFWF